jgi:hypothetical protein
MSVQITDELKQLNIAVKKESAQAFSDFVEHVLKADISQFEVNLPELREYQKQDVSSHRRIDLLIHSLEHDVFTSLDYGPATYQTTYAAAIVLGALYKYAGVLRDHQNELFSKVAEQYGVWLDPSKDGSPAALKHNEQVQIEAAKKAAFDIREKYKGGDYEILGGLDKGFTVRKLYTIPHPFGGNPKAELDGIKRDYDRQVEILTQLEKVVFQLEVYNKSLSKDRLSF